MIEDLRRPTARGMYEGGPPGTPGTAVELVKNLVDRTQSKSDAHDIAELHLFDGIVFVRKDDHLTTGPA